MDNDTGAVTREPLQAWVAQQLAAGSLVAALDGPGLVLQALSGDAGFRRYYRLNTRPSRLAVWAPPESENSRAFVAIANALRRLGVAAPEVFAVDYQRGYLVLEDFGDCLLGDLLSADNAERHYQAALEVLLRIQDGRATRLPLGTGEFLELPPYDRQRLHTEMALLPEWFLTRLLGLVLSPAENALLEACFRHLEDAALEQPQVWVHRDFHSRNLIWRPGQALGVIDFQDAVLGPVTYDLVSLLRDCYLRWPPQRVYAWVDAYREQAQAAGKISGVGNEQFRHWFDWMGLQRHIKVLGIFARLWLRDGKSRYLADLPLVLRYTLEVAERYPQFEGLCQLLRSRALPACEKQAWYSDYRRAGEPSEAQV